MPELKEGFLTHKLNTIKIARTLDKCQRKLVALWNVDENEM